MELVVSHKRIFDAGFISCRYFQRKKKKDAQLSLLTVKQERSFELEKREGRGDPKLQWGHPESSWDGEVWKFSPSPAPLSETGRSQRQPEISLSSLGWEREFCYF